ncbi:MAG: GNAT family N-acetyltransferase [Pseudomonadota bacterium]
MDPLTVDQDTPATPDVKALLLRHFDLMRASSPEESSHVMQPGALMDKGAVLFAARDTGTLLGVGALAQLDALHGELKSMHTAEQARGRGVGQAILRALLDHARAQGLTRVSLETGSADLFAPARALYARQGFVYCPPFGAYVEDPHSVFMTRAV